MEVLRKAPDLIGEYYELKEAHYLKNCNQTFYTLEALKGQFLKREIEEAMRNLERIKEKYPMMIKAGTFSTDREDLYLNWLKSKQLKVNNEETKQSVKPDEAKNPHETIFKDAFVFTLFDKMKGFYSKETISVV